MTPLFGMFIQSPNGPFPVLCRYSYLMMGLPPLSNGGCQVSSIAWFWLRVDSWRGASGATAIGVVVSDAAMPLVVAVAARISKV